MAYITSRRDELPSSRKEMEGSTWYNMWKRKLWPYRELVEGDLVYWYESRNKRVVWVSRLNRIERFQYRNKEQAARRIEKRLDGVNRNERYYKKGPARGYCLAYKVLVVKKINLPKPYGVAFRRSGWERVNEKWLRALRAW
ncbi:MAG: hypothetical protein ACE5H2_06885 [Terriglobia bacterium]